MGDGVDIFVVELAPAGAFGLNKSEYVVPRLPFFSEHRADDAKISEHYRFRFLGSDIDDVVKFYSKQNIYTVKGREAFITGEDFYFSQIIHFREKYLDRLPEYEQLRLKKIVDNIIEGKDVSKDKRLSRFVRKFYGLGFNISGSVYSETVEDYVFGIDIPIKKGDIIAIDKRVKFEVSLNPKEVEEFEEITGVKKEAKGKSVKEYKYNVSWEVLLFKVVRVVLIGKKRFAVLKYLGSPVSVNKLIKPFSHFRKIDTETKDVDDFINNLNEFSMEKIVDIFNEVENVNTIMFVETNNKYTTISRLFSKRDDLLTFRFPVYNGNIKIMLPFKSVIRIEYNYEFTPYDQKIAMPGYAVSNRNGVIRLIELPMTITYLKTILGIADALVKENSKVIVSKKAYGYDNNLYAGIDDKWEFKIKKVVNTKRIGEGYIEFLTTF